MNEIGRNDPCPCGSGRKYKKCCLEAAEGARRGDADFDPAAILDRVVETDDWRPLDPYVDRFCELAQPGGRLEHVRLPETGECTGGWLGWCERELAHASTRVDDRDLANALRMAAYLVRRFGAMSPILEELRTLQAAELSVREDAVRVLEVAHPDDATALVARAEAAVASGLPAFDDCEVLALVACDGPAAIAELWVDRLRRRVVDRALAALADPARGDRDAWRDVALAGWFARDRPSPMVRALVDRELDVSPTHLTALIQRHEASGRFGDAALVRDTLAALQRRARG